MVNLMNVDVLSKRWSRRDDYRRPEIIKYNGVLYALVDTW